MSKISQNVLDTTAVLLADADPKLTYVDVRFPNSGPNGKTYTFKHTSPVEPGTTVVVNSPRGGLCMAIAVKSTSAREMAITHSYPFRIDWLVTVVSTDDYCANRIREDVVITELCKAEKEQREKAIKKAFKQTAKGTKAALGKSADKIDNILNGLDLVQNTKESWAE